MSEHDTPTLESRVASLESEVRQLGISMASLADSMSRLSVHLPKRPGNCRHCGRQITGNTRTCNVCGKRQ